MILKRIVKSDGFRIYFWPIIVCYLFVFASAFLFTPFEAGSLRETMFLCMGNVTSLICLWVLVVRYQKVKGKSVGKRAIILLVILSVVVFLLDLTLCAFRFLGLSS